MSLLFSISTVFLFVYIIIYVFDPILSKRKEFNEIRKRNDSSVKKMFLFKQKSELELDLDIGNINLDEYRKEEIDLNKKLKRLDLEK